MRTVELTIIALAILVFFAVVVAMLIQQHQSGVVRAKLKAMAEKQHVIYNVADLTKLRLEVLRLATDYSVDFPTLMLIDSLEQRIALRISDLK